MDPYGAGRCIGCGTCTDVCPSARHGGIRPDAVVEAFNDGTEPMDVWICLQCHRCSAVCPEGIDVAGLICGMRNSESERGNIPERFRRSALQMKKDLRMYPTIGRTASQRAELGLSTGEITEEDRERVRNMLRGPGFDG